MDAGPTSEQVVEAFLHLGRLAAAHTNYAIHFSDAGTLLEHQPDERSVRTLREVTRLLRRDRERVRHRMVRALLQRAHVAVTAVFASVDDSDAEQCPEDLIQQRLRAELGITLTEKQMKQFSVDRKYVRDRQGASSAAADALGKAIGLGSGRSIFDARKQALGVPPVPGPLNRWVSLGKLRTFMDKALGWAEGQRRASAVVPLASLRSASAEALMERVESCFREDARRGLDSGRVELRSAILELLHGRPLAQKLPPELERKWVPLRKQFAEILAPVRDGLAPLGEGAVDALLESAADLFVDLLVQWLKTEFEVSSPSPPCAAQPPGGAA